jgi:hypothetical protein
MSVNSSLAVNSEISFLHGKNAITIPDVFHLQKRDNNHVTQQKSKSFLFSVSNLVCELDPAQEIFTETEGAETEWHTNSLPLAACESVICSLKIFRKLLIIVFSSVVFCHILDQTTYYEAK